MYSLYRDGDRYGVHQDSTVCLSDVPEPAPQPGGRRKRSGATYAQWKRFMDRGKTDGAHVGGEVLDSWRRCRDMDVDPGPRCCWEFTPMNSIEPFALALDEVGADVVAQTYKAIKGRNLLITITDAHAHVARTCGDLEPLLLADKLNFGPGASWTENSVGTNAIGTALVLGRPLQVNGEEHYCRSHHAWSCTAAPIFDPRGNVWGCFDISGPAEADHSKSMGLVLGAARELEKRLGARHLAELETRFCTLMSAVFNSVLTGVLSVSTAGRITSANSAAEFLLARRSGVSLRGRRADEFFDFDLFLASRKHDSPRAEPVVLACRTDQNLIARAAPVFSPGGVWCDTVVIVSEPQRVKPRMPAPGLGAGERSDARSAEGRAPGFEDVLHRSPAMREAVRKAANAARTPSTVLLTGESGTGKELFARGIHKAGPRAEGPFVAVNCGAISGELVQSELFGYRGGAFTGADRKGRTGKFEQADKGVLFLDEISEMPLGMQVNLLRALEERTVVPVGGTRPRPVDVKVLAATNRDLAECVARGEFREDLFYRINVVGIHIPPLRERADDVLLLARRHARRLCREFGVDYGGLAPEALEALAAHDWPGNVRELLNCVEYAVNNMDGPVIGLAQLPESVRGALGSAGAADGGDAADGFRLRDVEAGTIRDALRFHGGNVSRTAKALGIGRNTLYAKMQKLGIKA